MPSNKAFYRRLQVIDQCLRRRQKIWTVTALLEATNEHLEANGCPQISQRTLYDDLKYLQETLAAPVEKFHQGKTVCYRYSDPGYTMVNTPLTEAEKILLQKMQEYLKANGSPEPLLEGIAALLTRHGLMEEIELPKMMESKKRTLLSDMDASSLNAPAPARAYQKEVLPEDPYASLVIRMEEQGFSAYRESFWRWLEKES